MRQITHIFRKDLRRFRPEIAITLGLLAAFVWTEPPSWRPPDLYHSGSNYFQYNVSAWFAILLCMSWMLMVARIIHEESPVGDRQHWLTRPYEWPKVLAAKILFVLAVVNAPLLTAQFVLLAAGGFSPLSYFSGLLAKNLQLLAWIILPMAAVAVVTSGFTQMARVLPLALLFFFGVRQVLSMVPGIAAWHGDSLWNRLPDAVLFVGLIIVVVRQYALRKTMNARLLLMGWAVAVSALVAAIPYGKLIEHSYAPVSKEQTPFRLALDSAMRPGNPVVIPAAVKDVQLNLPISIGDVAGNTVVQLEAVAVTVEGPDGIVWNSGWQPDFKVLSRHEEPNVTNWWSTLGTEVRISRKFLDRLKDTPVRLRVAAAVTLFHSKDGLLITRTESEFEVPGLGRCVVGHQGVRLAWCRTPLRRPTMLAVSGQAFESCLTAKDGSSVPVTDFVSRLASGVPDFGLSPVAPFTPNLTISTDGLRTFSICPGMPLSFSRPEPAGHFRVEQKFDNVRLTDYWMGRFAESNYADDPGIRAIAH